MIFCWDNYHSKKNYQCSKSKREREREQITYEIFQVGSVDKLLVEMGEIQQVLHLLDLEIELDVLDDRVVLMEQMLYGRIETKKKKVLFVVLMLLVFEHIIFDRFYANLFHLSYCQINLILMLMLKQSNELIQK